MTTVMERQRRGIAAAVGIAGSHGLRVNEPVVLNDLFSLMLWLRPAPVVARVSAPFRLRGPLVETLQRELDVCSYLAGRGAPVVAPSPELPAGPYERDGFAVSFWTHLEADPDRAVTPADCSSMLVDLHAELRGYAGTLPDLCAIEFAVADAVLADAGEVLSSADRERVRTSVAELRSLVEEPSYETQPIHGDVHAGNIVATRTGPVWIDFENACRGPVEWDLATMWDPDAVALHHQPDEDLVAQCRRLRALQVVLALVEFDPLFGDQEGWLSGLRMMLDAL